MTLDAVRLAGEGVPGVGQPPAQRGQRTGDSDLHSQYGDERAPHPPSGFPGKGQLEGAQGRRPAILVR